MKRTDYSRPEYPSWPKHIWKGQRPPWWPENEPWPPRRRHWRGRAGHYPFFRRLGCLITGFSLLGFTVFISILLFVINSLGIIHIPFDLLQGILPFAGLFIVLMIFMLVRAGRNLRQLSVPLDDLLTASNKVAEGDYSTRVEERGPPEVLSLTRAFNTMASRLQVVDQQRRTLFAEVSHELRTPLTIIQGNLEGIIDGLYPADAPKLTSILEETQILSRLIDDLRTLSVAETGGLELRRERTDLVALLQEAVAGFASQADVEKVRVELSSAKDKFILEVDPERIHQVISNLITNALRYSPRNGLVQIKLTESESDLGKQAVITVSDNGQGITPEDLQHIFDRFYKSNDSHGMGLGLSIAKYLVEAHGGKIFATSQAGQGTTISFSLPC